jgi:hypothetical protein
LDASFNSPEMPVRSHTDNPYSVILPCSPDQFKDFVGGLLGEPQVITKLFTGEFEITKDNIIDLYHLVEQRVRQQNESTLLQFTVRIGFDDNSSILLNSIKDFEVYNEVRPVSSISAHLTWTFLVLFRDKTVPEKQTIEVSFATRDSFGRLALWGPEFIFPAHGFRISDDFISFRISHTARTWGADIESLLSGHIQVLLKTKNPLKEFARNQSGWIAFAVFSILFLSSVIGSFYTLNSFMHSQIEKVRALNALPVAPAGVVNNKVDYLIDLIASGAWPRYFFYIFVFLVVSLIISAFLALWAGTASEVNDPSFILLTRQSEKRKLDLLKKNKRQWIIFIGSIVSAVVVGIIKQIILSFILKTWPSIK